MRDFNLLSEVVFVVVVCLFLLFVCLLFCFIFFSLPGKFKCFSANPLQAWGVGEGAREGGRGERGIAHLVQRPTEKPGAMLTQVRVPVAAKYFSPRVHF